MNTIKAIGFDLFNTLITADPGALGEAMQRLTESLEKAGFKSSRIPSERPTGKRPFDLSPKASPTGKRPTIVSG